MLEKIFSDDELKRHIVFKGGTSLSKVYGLINRFSEDIDLVLDWRLLGYGEHLDVESEKLVSKTKRDQFNKAINAKAADYLRNVLVQKLSALFADTKDVACVMNPDDPQTINVAYPAAFSENYLRPEIWLEIGPLGSFVPSEKHLIRPYAAEVLPDLVGKSSTEVVAISAERTFWEKVTLLHQQAHRVDAMPVRYSRHYYDLFKLVRSPVKERALADLGLLAEVVAFKDRFYPSGWARYDLARPGTLRLSPAKTHTAELAKDYREMNVMLFGGVPDFAEIIAGVAELEAEINAKAST
ncbi:MAG: nucleotidyl transferase AbiEii/AbiGii toxin family protein [Bryobacteraceae bacterium]